ncbi:MAG: GspH/FimT family pseudopilin [Candidatus Margulisiibacteriota bacterium]
MRHSRGFTLTELVMVMVILSIIAVGSFVVISSYKTHELYAAAERIATDLRYAKNSAQSSGSWHGVLFDVSPTNTYTVYSTDGTADTNLSDPLDSNLVYTVNVYSNYRGVSITGASFGTGSKVEFNPFGTPYDDKTGSALTTAGIITLSLGSESRIIYIEPDTGRIHL